MGHVWVRARVGDESGSRSAEVEALIYIALLSLSILINLFHDEENETNHVQSESKTYFMEGDRTIREKTTSREEARRQHQQDNLFRAE